MDKGRWDYTSHLRCCYVAGNGLEFNRIMVSVPKRLYKRAVKRHLLKRRMREAYRLQKELLPAGFDLMFVYNSAEICDFAAVRGEVAELLARIAGR